MPRPRLLPLLALVVALGCQNNTIELETDPGSNDDDTMDGTMDGTGSAGTDTSSPTTTTTTTTGDPGTPQTLLMALETPLQPGLPFQALVNTTPGSGTVDLTIQWLALDLGSTTSPRDPVGDVYAYNGVPVDGSGTFYWDTGIILIPGRANPISGEDLVVSIQANVVPAGTPAYCGDVGGSLVSPIEFPLDGSTHAMTAVDPNNLPLDFATACP
ncbi:MAG: hypothetical protein KDK70_41680 [Myxococcales bacterium]|nr:hypothetical protein [Myxococcales bacterium]